MIVVSTLSEFVAEFKVTDYMLRKFMHQNFTDYDDYRLGLNGAAIIEGIENDAILISKFLNWKYPNTYIVLKGSKFYIGKKIDLISMVCNQTIITL